VSLINPGVLAEDVRQLTYEQNQALVDGTEYNTSAATMTELKNYGNVTLSKAGLLLFQWLAKVASHTGYYRLKVGSFYVYAVAITATTYPSSANCLGLVYLPAGTYAVSLEACSNFGVAVYAKSFECGVSVFSDLVGEAPQTYSTTLSVTIASRTTCIGALKTGQYMVQVVAYTAAAVTNMEDVGDNLTNGVSLTINGSQTSWNTKLQDADSKQCAYGENRFFISVGSAMTFAISKRNANTVVHISVVACPWLLISSECEPVTLAFSQQSTIYINLAPMLVDETKTLILGKKRAISFGAAVDYFSTSSGVGLVSWSYTFSLLLVGDCRLYMYGVTAMRTCIEMIGIDPR